MKEITAGSLNRQATAQAETQRVLDARIGLLQAQQRLRQGGAKNQIERVLLLNEQARIEDELLAARRVIGDILD